MFQRVDAQRAGQAALGILIPHGAKTLVIVRPRALSWDLLPAQWDGDSTRPPRFCTFERDEAARVARRFIEALESAVARGINPMQTFGDAADTSLQVWLHTSEYVWIVCRRTPGQAYQPMIFASRDEATREADAIAAIVWPAPGCSQEYYFNTQNFT